MLLQRGKFLIEDISKLDSLETDKDGLKKIIDLSYMGQFEYEGNAIPLSRMFIELYKDEYQFYPINQFDANGKQMYFYFNSTLLEENNEDETHLEKYAKRIINRNCSLGEYMLYPNRDNVSNFWWNIEADYFIFFGEEKKELVNYFINGCFERDGKVEGIQKKLKKAGYNV